MNKKFFYALITVVTILVIVLIKIYFYNLDKKWYKKIDYNSYVLIVNDIHNKYPNLFKFDENNDAIMTVEELVTKQDEIEFDIAHDKDGNMCIGYFIVSKVGEGIDIDASHMCDMINY